MDKLCRTIAVAAFCAFGFAQTAEQPVTLIIEIDNALTYRGDVTDSTKLARDPGVTTPLPARAFQVTYNVGDIVGINGKSAKGLMSALSGTVLARVNPQSGQMIADFDGSGPFLTHWQILAPDGTWLGSMWGAGGVPAPGQGHSIMSGNGVFLGVEGEYRILELITASRIASVTEDPANRRINGGQKLRFIFYLYPKYRPAVDVSPTGPAVFHGDFSPVTAASPARAGEVLIVRTRNLGPTRPELLPPGTRPFKADPVEEVNSPVGVTVGGKDAEVINKIGWPGTHDLYRVDFRVPAGISPGMVTIQLTSAWIPGPEVKIPVQ